MCELLGTEGLRSRRHFYGPIVVCVGGRVTACTVESTPSRRSRHNIDIKDEPIPFE